MSLIIKFEHGHEEDVDHVVNLLDDHKIEFQPDYQEKTIRVEELDFSSELPEDVLESIEYRVGEVEEAV